MRPWEAGQHLCSPALHHKTRRHRVSAPLSPPGPRPSPPPISPRPGTPAGAAGWHR